MDVWRDFFPSGRDYTHFSHPHSVYTRIDYFLMYNTERHRIIQCDIGNIDISDHSPVYLVINLNKKYRQTLWKLNSSILNSQQVKEALEDEIQTYMEFNDTGEVEPPLLWDALKAVMRGNIIARTARLKKLRQERLSTLQSKLKDLQREHKDNMDRKVEHKLKLLKMKSTIYTYKKYKRNCFF